MQETPIKIMKDNKSSDPANESTLDLENISGMANRVPTQFWHYSCTKETCHPFMSLLTDLSNLSDADLPNVLSVSVGVTEEEYITELGLDFANRVNTEFMKLGVRGMSIMFAAGDKGTQEDNDKVWINFPSSSP